MEHYERHCPPPHRRLNCLIPPPPNYKVCLTCAGQILADCFYVKTLKYTQIFLYFPARPKHFVISPNANCIFLKYMSYFSSYSQFSFLSHAHAIWAIVFSVYLIFLDYMCYWAILCWDRPRIFGEITKTRAFLEIEKLLLFQCFSCTFIKCMTWMLILVLSESFDKVMHFVNMMLEKYIRRYSSWIIVYWNRKVMLCNAFSW